MADNEEQEKTYEVKDKRRVNPDGTPRDEAEPEQAQAPEEQHSAEPTATADEEAVEGGTAQEAPPPGGSEEQQPLPPPNIYAMLEFMVGLLTEQAWQLMGLRLAPGQKEPMKDMTQAKLGIDTVVFIADKLHPHLGEDDRRALRGLISDLQINFVQQSQKVE